MSTHARPLPAEFEDRILELVPQDAREAPPHMVKFVRELGPAISALDFGCGDGRLTRELRAGDVTAADVSLTALKRARAHIPDALLILVEEQEFLPFDDEAFDLVLCTEVIEYVHDVPRLLADLRRVLVPGGTLALSTPAHGRLTALRLLRHGFDDHFDPLSARIRYFSRDSLEYVLDFAGFGLDEMTRSHGLLLAIATR